MEKKSEKRYFWLKLKDDFFKQKELKKLRNVAGGDTYTIIYLKMQLLSLKNEGKLIFDELEDTFAEELSLELDETVENIKMTLAFLKRSKLFEEVNEIEFILPEAVNNIGSEGQAADRMRKLRSQRDSTEKVKKECNQRAIPLIEDWNNKNRYNGNYYLVLQRDDFKCCICDKNDNLCVHHILGFDKNKPQNSNKENMVTLCRQCHAQVHRGGLQIPQDVFDYIGFFENQSEQCSIKTEQCSPVLGSVTQRKREERELEKDISPIVPFVEVDPKAEMAKLKKVSEGAYQIWEMLAKEQNIEFTNSEWNAIRGYAMANPKLRPHQITGSILQLEGWALEGRDIRSSLLDIIQKEPSRYNSLKAPFMAVVTDTKGNRVYGEAIVARRQKIIEQERQGVA